MKIGNRYNPGRVNPKAENNMDGDVQVKKKMGIYETGEGQTANALYKRYKVWFYETKGADQTPLPFSEWIAWAQQRGIVNKLSADANYDTASLARELSAYPDNDVQQLEAKMQKAKTDNWGPEMLATISGATHGLQISDQETLAKAYSVVKTEMKKRKLASIEYTPPKTDTAEVRKNIRVKIALAVGFGILVVVGIVAMVPSGKKA